MRALFDFPGFPFCACSVFNEVSKTVTGGTDVVDRLHVCLEDATGEWGADNALTVWYGAERGVVTPVVKAAEASAGKKKKKKKKK